MIYKDEEQTMLEFGKGDICVSGGHFIDDSNEKIGVVTFNNQSPREIGAEGDLEVGKEYDTNIFPIIMTFTKAESIDVVINTLKQAKIDMLSKNK